MKTLSLQLLYTLFFTISLTAQSGFGTVSDLSPVTIAYSTGDNTQSKAWTYAGKHWCVLATASGTNIFRLDGATWTNVFLLASGSTAKADIKVVGNVTHIFTWKGTTSYLYSVEYNPATNNYKLWTVRNTRVAVVLDNGTQTANIDIDGTGRMWLASDGDKNMNVRWSDAPYALWSGPVELANGATTADLCSVIALNGIGKVAVFWSNKTTKRFGFKTHNDGADPTIWSADEAPGSSSAVNVGTGFADNQLNLKATSNGTLYSVVKTGYNTAGNPQIDLLLRRPDGTWDPVYPVTINEGTKPVAIINESLNKLKVVYTLSTGIAYKESSLSSISFGSAITIINGAYDNATSTKATYNPEIVVIASNATTAVSVLGVDNSGAPPDQTPPTVTSITRQSPLAQTTNASGVTFRVTFSENVSGVDATDFALTVVSGAVTGTLGTVTPVGTGGTTYDVGVSSVTGNGTIRLDLQATATGIADAANNAIATGFTGGETYIISQNAPTLTPVTIASNNPTPSLARTGDIITLSFTASEAINPPSVIIATHAVTATAGAANSYTATYTMVSGDAEGVIPFTINFSNTAGTAGTQVATTTNGSNVTFDKTPPTVASITRQSPLSQTTNATSVTFRVLFAEQVSGVDITDFALAIVSGAVSGTLNTVTAIGTGGTTYDVSVSSVTGNGSIRLDLQATATGIADAAGNAIATGFTGGETYIISQNAPTLTPVTIASNNTTPSLARTGDLITLSFTASEAINPPSVTITTHVVTATAGAANSYTATYTMVSGDAEGAIPFTINFSNTSGTAGVQVTTTTNGSSVTFDKTVPTVTSITRQSPLSQTTNASGVTFRVTSSENVSGVDITDFALTVVSGAVTGTLGTVTPVGTGGTTYDVTVSGISGNGTLRLDLKPTGTGIADAAGNAIATGFTSGETYIISQNAPTLTPVTIASNNVNPSLAKPSNIITLSFTASEAINPPSVTIATHAVTATAGAANSYTATYTITGGNVEGVIPFTINFSNTSGTAGVQVTTTTNGSSVTFDKTAPIVTSINRQSPLSQTTNASGVTFRVTFSENVSGVDITDFALTVVSGAVTGTLGTVTPVGTGGTTYDVTASGISGNGTLRLDLKATGTGITDATGNAITTGFTGGETYIISQNAPTLTLVTIASNNAVPSLARTGDLITLSFTASEAINPPSATIATHAVTATAGVANSYTATYTLVSGDAEGVIPFTINFSNTVGTAGTQVTTTTNGSSVTFDKTPPTVTSITRQSPLSQTTNASGVTFRVTSSENVSGVDITDFALTVVSGAVTGTLGTVTPVGTGGTTYDVTASGVSGNGTLRLDLKATGTGITDAAGNAITTGFTGGETYIISQNAPTLTSVTIVSNNPNPSLAKPFNIITLSFTASEAINPPSVKIATHTVTATAGANNSYTVTYTMATGDASGVVPFAINFSSIAGTPGAQVTTTTNGSSITFDKTAPFVLSLTRQNPFAQTTNSTTVTFRITFSEQVSGVDVTDFVVTLVSGAVMGTLAGNSITPVGAGGTTYDVTLFSVFGNGTLRLDLKAISTGISDPAGNTNSTGFTSAETYIISGQATQPGFVSLTPLTPVNLTLATKDKPQAKTWKYAGQWWSVLSATGGTKIYRLDGTSWTDILTLNNKSSKPDCRVVGDLVHLLLYKGASNNSFIYSIKYDVPTNTYKLWATRPTASTLFFPAGSETGTIAVDGTGRMWAASDGASDIVVWYSDAPYTTWSAPITIATGVKDDDICALVVIPNQGKIGIFWSNQTTKRFGFRTHADGSSPSAWTADELPASQSAIDNVGVGMADDHMNLKVGSDGTVYCAAKTSYNTNGFPKLILFVRRPNGVWDNQYTVSMNPEGTQPIVILNEAKHTLKVIYASLENGGNILYRESSMDAISFSPAITMLNDGNLYDYCTSTHQNYTAEIVILATNLSANPIKAVGFLASDSAQSVGGKVIAAKIAAQPLTETKWTTGLQAYPNPYTMKATLSFTVETSGAYTITLYNTSGTKQILINKGWAKAGENTTLKFDGSSLPGGVYFVKLQTEKGSRILKLIRQK
jgi:hypothetical protein